MDYFVRDYFGQMKNLGQIKEPYFVRKICSVSASPDRRSCERVEGECDFFHWVPALLRVNKLLGCVFCVFRFLYINCWRLYSPNSKILIYLFSLAHSRLQRQYGPMRKEYSMVKHAWVSSSTMVWGNSPNTSLESRNPKGWKPKWEARRRRLKDFSSTCVSDRALFVIVKVILALHRIYL